MVDIAAIFDMDGVLIDSEPLWCRAEVEVFNHLGVPLTESMSSQTMGLRTDEVVSYWYAKFPWTGANQSVVADRILSQVGELVATEGKPMPGAVEAVQLCRRMQLPLALATSSPMSLVHLVLKRLGLQDAFDVLNSAETEEFGKPHPAVYLTTAHRLGVHPSKCIAVEDSIRGMMSAKTAGMRCIVVPAAEERENPQFAAADFVLDSLETINQAWLERVIYSLYSA
ncbi:Hexitol phosphatase B [Planktothrix tepida]|uniref:2-deoxyglucose-6-phosphate phosphatase n=1 Tax=Planktothrix tepida PCC 9214 TaxID=671072 RepID=A0A1J1LU80_9CYAN|nr:hexitol phosphatase HxpB [Planktothrix tepida]CAD5967046.1 Hexitol phosphatase B [Planktothrix tepida]CUR35105.1 2-deoxyglucose-6-phosphate phosphatase [Planktothrix tepida PCC 9214]